MTDAPAPSPAAPRERFTPGWAFAAAAAAFAIALAGLHRAQPSAWAQWAALLACVAMPGWIGVGVMIANRPDDERRAKRSRALTLLTAVVMGLVLAGALFALLYAAYPIAAYTFAAAGLAMLFWADRAS